LGKRASRLAGAAEASERRVMKAMVLKCMMLLFFEGCCVIEKLKEDVACVFVIVCYW
jgi:hypothetical protein